LRVGQQNPGRKKAGRDVAVVLRWIAAGCAALGPGPPYDGEAVS